MREMYKAGNTCKCEPEQVSALEAAGWSLNKATPVVAEAPKVVDTKKVTAVKAPKEESQEQSGE